MRTRRKIAAAVLTAALTLPGCSAGREDDERSDDGLPLIPSDPGHLHGMGSIRPTTGSTSARTSA